MTRLMGGAFDRGLPTSKELRSLPDVVELFRTLLINGAVVEAEHRHEAIAMCHRNGWIHSIERNDVILYTLPSPLHAAFLSWRLTPTNNKPDYNSIFDLCLAVISKFKPSQLHLPIRRAGCLDVESVPEAQYQDEFYRSMFSITSGDVRLSPEFTSAKGANPLGRIDFFIPVMKWGIEITRDGNLLKQHHFRFTASGAYGAWLQSNEMVDYILLDFRTSLPIEAHPSMIHDFLLIPALISSQIFQTCFMLCLVINIRRSMCIIIGCSKLQGPLCY